MSVINTIDSMQTRLNVLFYIHKEGMVLKEDLLRLVDVELSDLDIENSSEDSADYIEAIQKMHEKDIINDADFLKRLGFAEYSNELLE